jgi:hypothetical protein
VRAARKCSGICCDRPTLTRHLALLWASSTLPAEEPNRNARFGLLGPAKADPKQREDFLIEWP